MAVSYKKLSHLLIEREISHSKLQRLAGYSANITTRLKSNTYVSLESLEKVCNTLGCTLDDIVEFVPDKGDTEQERE